MRGQMHGFAVDKLQQAVQRRGQVIGSTAALASGLYGLA
jgi:hypothetical protein